MPSMKSENPATQTSPGAHKAWLLAARPRTWIASISPVLIGTALAMREGAFDLFLFSLTLCFGLLIQIGTNFANDAFDFLKGADTTARIGPKRATQQGWISAQTMIRAALLVFFFACLAALPLMIRAGWWSFPLAALCILFGLAYTGGPKPLGYLGLGELLVFFFFGPIAVCGTYFLQTSQLNSLSLLAGCAPGLLSCSLLIANNLRDEKSDRIAGKRTIVVRFGKQFGCWEYTLTILFAALIPAALVFLYQAPKTLLLASSILPLSYPCLKQLFRSQNQLEIIPVLQKSALLLYVYTIFFCVGALW